MILCEHQNDLAKFVPANQLELERLEQMLNYLNTHFESIISLQELADQVHLSREVCCRLFKKMTVIENVMLPLSYTNVPRSQREMRAVHALQAVTLPVDHWDHRISELSGGQMQRVAIARALVNDPPIILADEPTGNLDSATGALVMETFHKLQERGKTIVLITHDPGIAAEADRAVTIRDGRIHDGAYIPHAPRTLRSAVDSLPMISASANPPKGVMA